MPGRASSARWWTRRQDAPGEALLAPDCTLRRRDGGCCCSKQADVQGKSPLLMSLLRPLLPIGWSRQLQGLERP